MTVTDYEPVAPPPEEMPGAQPILATRLSGAGQSAAGGMLIFVGLAALAIAILLPAPNPAKSPISWAGIGMINLGIFLWALGQVLRALFFLPGRQVAIDDLSWWNRAAQH